MQPILATCEAAARSRARLACHGRSPTRSRDAFLHSAAARQAEHRAVVATRRSTMARYGKKSQEKVEEAMHEFKRGELKSSTGQKVKNPKQAIAIGLSEARSEGGKVPPAKKAAGKKTTAKKTAAKKAPAKKAAAKKTSAKTTAKKSAARKTTGTKAAAKKTTAKKTTAKKASAKTTARKSAAGKSTTRKTTARKTSARKNAAKKSS
ncbi:DNA-binding protein [Ramlibacter henchirensis]|uniref:DNA-binding protein n=1 Tax=Ramlibacter henchirensis TaxID=204072 RepID=A0A4Z0CAI8_9BURK|nr:DUF6496 domain-containing protein [Ramlibacter henchirensis]TFZ07089.1 DNA-binding protein [Ramlibacter henchirensis]